MSKRNDERIGVRLVGERFERFHATSRKCNRSTKNAVGYDNRASCPNSRCRSPSINRFDPMLRAMPPGLSCKSGWAQMASERIEIPCIINGKEVRTGKAQFNVVMPHAHGEVLAKVHMAGEKEIRQAAQPPLDAKAAWERFPWEHRAEIFSKRRTCLPVSTRDALNAATMLGQSKNVYQAEIDSACELIDFLRFNVYYYQHLKGAAALLGVNNRLEYRALEGFVLAITPFNFTAIGRKSSERSAHCRATRSCGNRPKRRCSGVLHDEAFEKRASAGSDQLCFQPRGRSRKCPDSPPRSCGDSFHGFDRTFRQIWKQVAGNH